jgi:uncharacterized protein involved in exopolysaccharide biosynthesis
MSGNRRNNEPSRAAQNRRELDIFDLAAFVWTQLWLAVLVALIVFVPLVALAVVSIKPSYESTSRLLVILDDTDLTPGTAGTGGQFILDQVMESEAEIFNSDAVRRRALEDLGQSPSAAMTRTLAEAFSIARSPNASILVAKYETGHPVEASRTLNALVDAYLAYRVDLLLGTEGGVLSRRLDAAERQAALSQNELRDFLIRHELSDFDLEMAAIVQRISDLEARKLSAMAEAQSADTFAASLRSRLSQIPQAIDLYVENDVTGQLLALEVERESLLARYLPDATPVQAIDRQIEVLRRFIDAGGAAGQGQIRTGINPVWQELQHEKLRQESFRDSQVQLSHALDAQIRGARAEADRLRELAPEHARLQRAVLAQAQAAEQVSLASADASARRSGLSGAADAVRIVERATPPDQASSLLVPVIILAFGLAAGLGGLAALLRGYWVSERSGQTSPGGPDGRRNGQKRNGQSRNGEGRRLPVLARVPEY